jgi:hypothetical protein
MFLGDATIAELANYIFSALANAAPVVSSSEITLKAPFELDAALAKFSKWAQEFQPGQIQRIAKHQVHKDKEINVLIARLEKMQEDVIIGEMVQDINHQFFYEHPKDHVPGMYLIEVARQAATVLSHCYYDVPTYKAYILDELKADFTKFVEHDRPTFWVAQVSDKGYIDGELLQMHVNCSFVQSGKVVAVVGGLFRMFDPEKYNRIRAEQMQVISA